MELILNIISLVIIVVFIRFLYRRYNSLMNLGILFMLNFALNYPLRLIAINFSDDIITDMFLDALRANLFELSLISFLAVTFFLIGFISFIKRRSLYQFLDSDALVIDQSAYRIIWVTFVISVIAKGIKIATGNYISFLLAPDLDYSYANLLENMHMIGWIAFAGSYILFFKNHIKTKSHLAMFFLINIIQLGYQVIQGSKTFLSLPLLIIAFAYYYSKKRIPFVLASILIIWFIIFVFPFVSNYRDIMIEKYATLPKYADFDMSYVLRETISRTFEDAEPSNSSNAPIWKAYSRFSGADELYRIMNMVPSIMPYKNGKDLLGIFYTFIPRFIWSSKPVLSPGAEYGKALGTLTSVTPFPVGEMYWNLGYFGVVIGMFTWGAFLSLLMNLVARFYNGTDMRFFVTSAFIAELYWYSTGESMLPIMMASTIKVLMVYIFIFLLIKVVFLENRSQILKRKIMKLSKFKYH